MALSVCDAEEHSATGRLSGTSGSRPAKGAEMRLPKQDLIATALVAVAGVLLHPVGHRGRRRWA